MRILRSTPFILLHISIAILGIGCVLLGSRGTFEPFNVFPLAVTLIAVGGIMTAAFGVAAWMYVIKMIENGKIDEEDDDGD